MSWPVSAVTNGMPRYLYAAFFFNLSEHADGERRGLVPI